MPNICVVGTDTGVGKTVVTGLLARAIRDTGQSVTTQKWVQTGQEGPLSPDLQVHSQILSEDLSTATHHLRCPYSFQLPASPHLAARVAGHDIQLDRIRQAYHALSAELNSVVVEGSGGLLVPITDQVTQLDLIQELGLPVLLVVANRLGCINHALLSLEVLRGRGIGCVGVVFNRVSSELGGEIECDNPRIVEALGGVVVLGEIDYREDFMELASVNRTVVQGIASACVRFAG